jgi:site-specific DNA-methyltransferase (cytosine-N4-specific)
MNLKAWFNITSRSPSSMHNLNTFYSKKENRYLTHNFHPYPHKLLPPIARVLIQEYSMEDDTILDPFCGSGTTLIEANITSRNVIGFDINPIACLISKVKTTILNGYELRKELAKLLQAVYSSKEFYEIPIFPKREYWFNPEALSALAVLRRQVYSITNKAMQDFFLVAFSSILKPASQASSLYRLTKGPEKKITKSKVFALFQKKVEEMVQQLDIFSRKSTGASIDVYAYDARDLGNYQKSLYSFDRTTDSSWKLPKQVDLIITNPPRFNFEFNRTFCINLWWMDMGDLHVLSKNIIGTKKTNGKIIHLNCSADSVIGSISRNGVAAALSQYFYDIKRAFLQMYKLLKEDKYFCLQSSDFVLYGIAIPVTRIFIELAEKSGFVIEKRIERRIPKCAFIYAQQDKVEDILVFKKARVSI